MRSHATMSPASSRSSASEGRDVALGTGPRPQIGREVLLAVEDDAPLVHLAVEVDGELGDPQQRPVDLHAGGLGRRRSDDPAGQAEVAVEPRVQQDAAVDLDAELAPARRTGVGRAA